MFFFLFFFFGPETVILLDTERLEPPPSSLVNLDNPLPSPLQISHISVFCSVRFPFLENRVSVT